MSNENKFNPLQFNPSGAAICRVANEVGAKLKAAEKLHKWGRDGVHSMEDCPQCQEQITLSRQADYLYGLWESLLAELWQGLEFSG